MGTTCKSPSIDPERRKPALSAGFFFASFPHLDPETPIHDVGPR
jgi:hypothetical protein